MFVNVHGVVIDNGHGQNVIVGRLPNRETTIIFNGMKNMSREVVIRNMNKL